ncbi:hypothetical protein ACDA63_15710 [Uliginosibacterium sp. sgz301328]|uniref:hypothetical protein n=1 Tax=Uliginosibacterium sp. sgz301328 TaxID=3243764 RepID=UPI00359EE5B8
MASMSIAYNAPSSFRTVPPRMSSERIRVVCWWGVIASSALLLVILMLPYLRNGFWFDDSLNSQTWGAMNRFHENVWWFSGRVAYVWFTEYGRVLLGWPLAYGFYYYIHDALLARCLDVGLLLIHVGVTVVLLRRLGVGQRLVAFFLLLLFPLFQIRNSDDPIAAYITFCHVLGIMLTLALLGLQKWRETDSPGWLIASSLLATLSMLCYELNAIYVPIALAAVWASKRVSPRNLLVILVPFACFVAANLFAKHMATNIYGGSQFGQVSAIPPTYLKQFVAAFPGSFYALDGHNQLSPAALVRLAAGSWLAWAIAVVWAALFLVTSRTTAMQRWPREAVFGAALLLFIPPALIAISAKYQASLSWGAAHIPVYYEYFGLAFIGAALLDRTIPPAARRLGIAVALPLALYASLNWVMNMQQSVRLDAFYRAPRDSLVAALRNGLMNEVRDGDIVHIENLPIFINGNLIYQAIQKNVSVPNETAIAGWFESPPRADAREFRLTRSVGDGNQWAVERVAE